MLKSRKTNMTNIKELRNLWTDEVDTEKQADFNRAFRKIRYIIIFKYLNIANTFYNNKVLGIYTIQESRILHGI